jgi:NAD(P)-dependent dehydrogenase (short-subunit alcohol dehydrogenase family)
MRHHHSDIKPTHLAGKKWSQTRSLSRDDNITRLDTGSYLETNETTAPRRPWIDGPGSLYDGGGNTELSMSDLANKAALVTGAQQGIGAAIAIALARAGADVAINYLDGLAAAEAVAAAIRALGRRAILVPGDVAAPGTPAALVGATTGAFGKIDILVNNAGVFPRVAMLDMTDFDWDFVHSVNLKGGFFCAQAAARAMIEGGQDGAIVNLASSAVFGASPRGVHYATSKGGIVSMTRAMATELAPYRIRVNAIAPGLTDTAQPRYGMSEEELAARGAAMPLGRLGKPEDIAHVATFLASDKAAFITGQVVHANGGLFMAS